MTTQAKAARTHKMPHAYRDPPDNERCEHRAFVRGTKETARCGRRKSIGPFCQQHHGMAQKRLAAAITVLNQEQSS